jgi:hypothetical protein
LSYQRDKRRQDREKEPKMRTLIAVMLVAVVGLVVADVAPASGQVYVAASAYRTGGTTMYSGYGYGYGSTAYMSGYSQRVGNTTFYNAYGTGGYVSATANRIGNTTFVNGYASPGYRFSGTVSRIGSMTSVYLYGN